VQHMFGKGRSRCRLGVLQTMHGGLHAFFKSAGCLNWVLDWLMVDAAAACESGSCCTVCAAIDGVCWDMHQDVHPELGWA
jgi:hypothetical protein